MTDFNRRAFLWSGVAGLAGTALAGPGLDRDLPRRERGTVGDTHEAFLIEPGVIARVSGSTTEPSLWGFAASAEPDLPLLTRPFVPDIAEAEAWVAAAAEGGASTGDGTTTTLLASLRQHPAIGATAPPDVVLDAADALSSDGDSTFSVEFMPSYENQSRITSFGAFPLIGTRAPAAVRADAYGDPIVITDFQGWRLQFRPPHVHPLGACVTVPVNHIHLEITHRDRYNSFRYPVIMTLHLGVYRSGGRRCLVLYNSPWPNVCWKVCGPTWNDLRNMLAWALTAAAAALGISIAGWVVSVISSVGASVLYVPVLVAL